MNQSLTTHSESDILIAIENFIVSLCILPFNERKFRDFLQEYSLLFQSIYKSDYEYSESIEHFKKLVCHVENIMNGRANLYGEALNAKQIISIVELICENKIHFAKQLIGLRAQEKRNKESLETYITQLTRHYSKLLFIRIDVAILKQHQHSVDIQQFNNYLTIFINRIQNQDTCFNDLEGYAWAIEQGDSKGYHSHILLIYDGHKHQKDFGMAIQVGQCWTKITKGKGYVFTSNSPEYKERFNQKGILGIGMIHRNKPEQVQNAINAAMYLVNPEKDQQHLRVKAQGMRTFGKGQFVIKKRRGCVVKSLTEFKGFKLCKDYS